MATRRTADAESTVALHDRQLSRRVLVLIRREQTTATPRVVWAHEVPVLQAIFGEDEVQYVDADAMDEGYRAKVSADMLVHNKRQDQIPRPSDASGIGWVFVGNAAAEYERLAAAYGKHNEVNQPNVEYVYGRFARGDFARIVGRPTFDDMPDGQLRDMILSWGHQMPVATKDSTEAEKQAAAKAWAEFRALPHAALVKLAGDVGVEIG